MSYLFTSPEKKGKKKTPIQLLDERMDELYDTIEKNKTIADIDLRLTYTNIDYERTARALRKKYSNSIKYNKGVWQLIEATPIINFSNSTNQLQVMQEPLQITQDWEL